MITQAEPMTGTGHLTHSSEQAFMACHRLYYWSYERGWRPRKKKKPLRIGAAGHHGIDMIAKGAPMLSILEAIDDIYAEHITVAADWADAQQGQYDLELEAMTVKCLVEGYAVAWANTQIEIIESEKSFDLPIVNPETGRTSRTFRQAGKRDRIARLPDDRIVLMETKFTGEDISPGSDFWQVLVINQQISKYMLAAMQDGHEVESALYDVIRKPTIKPTAVPRRDETGLKIVLDRYGERCYTKQHKFKQTAKTDIGEVLLTDPMTPKQWRYKLSEDIKIRPEYYYHRQEIPRLHSDLEEYKHELWWIAEAVRHCRNSGHWFRNSGACKRFRSLCPYHPLCAGEIDVSAGVPAGFRQAETAHEELTEPVKEGKL